MKNRKDRVFVIKSTNYSEADKIVTVFSRNRGRFAFLAKGIRKINSKNRGNIQTFSVSDISYFQGNGIPLLLESSQIAVADYSTISTDIAKRILRMLNKLTVDESPNEKVFDALENIVTRGITDELVNKFRTIFLTQEGLLGDLTSCMLCQSIDNLNLDKYSLELFCENCIMLNSYERNRFIPINSEIYGNKEYSRSLDKYIEKIIEES